MLNFFVMTVVYAWGLLGGCCTCYVFCAGAQAVNLEQKIYDSIRMPDFDEKMKKFKENIEEQ